MPNKSDTPMFIKAGDEFHFYVRDSAKEIRWVVPISESRPFFLSLYNADGPKAYLFNFVVKIIFLIGWGRKIFSSGVNGELDPNLVRIVDCLGCSGYSIFTGTPGKNRKVIIECNDGKKTKYFIKVPCGEGSFGLIGNEYHMLNHLGKLNLKKITAPSVGFYDECKHIIAVSNIKPDKRLTYRKSLLDVHVKSLLELYAKTLSKAALSDTSFYRDEISKLDAVSSGLTSSLDADKVIKLKDNLFLLELYLAKRELLIALGHCDFTPWNMYVTRRQLYVYDWELARSDAPVFFDCFHYIYQASVLVKHYSYAKIKPLLNKLKRNELIADYLHSNDINLTDYHAAYLLCNVSYYLRRYATQEDLHVQAHWLLDVWLDATNDIASDLTILSKDEKDN